ncbi:MAG TPA: hypothetical protein VGQ38_02960 [Gaiellaceae bacterium]|nr:hypothetical protein [Gaiellaceae bacterium]
MRALLFGAAAVLATALTAAAAAGASQPQAKSDSAQFLTEGGVAAQYLANARTIAHWSFQYTDPTNGVTYPITMVGSDPRAGGSTTVHTVIVPLALNFVAGNQDTSSLNDLGWVGFRATPLNHTFDGSTRVNDVTSTQAVVRSVATLAVGRMA